MFFFLTFCQRILNWYLLDQDSQFILFQGSLSENSASRCSNIESDTHCSSLIIIVTDMKIKMLPFLLGILENPQEKDNSTWDFTPAVIYIFSMCRICEWISSLFNHWMFALVKWQSSRRDRILQQTTKHSRNCLVVDSHWAIVRQPGDIQGQAFDYLQQQCAHSQLELVLAGNQISVLVLMCCLPHRGRGPTHTHGCSFLWRWAASVIRQTGRCRTRKDSLVTRSWRCK